ncbi:MAG: DUF5946 family protein [Myxococcales bacterium]
MPWLGVEAPEIEGTTDPYAGASRSCWAIFSEVCAKDYGDYRYPAVHRLIVDAYMAQHPNFSTPAGRRSIAVHLVGLYCLLEEGLSAKDAGRAMGAVFPDKRDTPAFEPTPWLGEVTIASLHSAKDLSEHQDRAMLLARAVWRAWGPYHPQVKQLRLGAIAR